jgi:hypothetical protein
MTARAAAEPENRDRKGRLGRHLRVLAVTALAGCWAAACGEGPSCPAREPGCLYSEAQCRALAERAAESEWGSPTEVSFESHTYAFTFAASGDEVPLIGHPVVLADCRTGEVTIPPRL